MQNETVFLIAPADSCISKSTSLLEDFESRYKDRHVFFYTDTVRYLGNFLPVIQDLFLQLKELSMFIEIIYKDIADPLDSGVTGLKSWVTTPCLECNSRQESSSFLSQLAKVKFEEIRQGKTPETLVGCITLVTSDLQLNLLYKIIHFILFCSPESSWHLGSMLLQLLSTTFQTALPKVLCFTYLTLPKRAGCAVSTSD